jgi:FkbM family methyltransferase
MRILWTSDRPTWPTGFGNTTHALCSGLARLGHQISIIGGKEGGRPWRRGQLTIYPGDGRNPDANLLLGYLRKLRPDILVTLIEPGEAIFVTKRAITRFRRSANVLWVLYYPLDCDRGKNGLPAKIIRFLKAADLRVVISRYGRDVTRSSGISAAYIPHGVDTSLFHPPDDKSNAKRALGYQNQFVVLCDARNQIRKLLPRTLEIFRRFAADKDDVRLHLHCDPYDPAARSNDYCYNVLWDVELLGLGDKVMFTRGMSICRGLSLVRLAALYQAADVHLLTSCAEGFGMPTLQAAAAGAVPLAPDYAANRELVRGHGEVIRVQRFVRNEAGWRYALVDIDDAVLKLERLYRNRTLLESKAQAARDFAESYDWKKVVRQWHDMLEREVPRLRTRNVLRRATPNRSKQLRREIRDNGIRSICGFTIPLTLPPANISLTKSRVTGRVCLTSPADLRVFQKLRRVFPRLTAWSPAQISARVRDDGNFKCKRVSLISAAFRIYFSKSTLALDIAGVERSFPLMAAKSGVPLIGLRQNPGQQRFWPNLTLDTPNVSLAAEKGRKVLTDHIEAADACALAKKRSRKSVRDQASCFGHRLKPMRRAKPFDAVSDSRYGTMLYNPYDVYIGRSIGRYGEFAELEVQLLCQILRRGHTVVDAGANIGTHTLAFAKVVGARGVVHAFEPQRIVFQTLCANLSLNRVHNVCVYHAALGADSGSACVPVPDYDHPDNFGGFTLNSSTNGEMVPMLTIDQLHLKQCHVIKIDVEGMEWEVLKGATQTIQRLRPILYLENDREEKSPVLVDQIRRFRYRLWSHTPPLFNPDNFAHNCKNVFPRIVSANMLCLPKELEARVTGLREVMSGSERIPLEATPAPGAVSFNAK